MIRLGSDISKLIMDILYAESPKTLNQVALVNSFYYRLARYAQHHDISVTLAEPAAIKQRVGLMEKSELLPAVRRLRVHGGYRGTLKEQASQVCRGTTLMMCNLLPRLTGLTDLEAHLIDIPREILEVLHNLPSVRLHIVPSMIDARDPGAHEGLVALQGMPNLRSMDVNCLYFTAQPCSLVTAALKRVLLSCPNVSRLSLDIGGPKNGCCMARITTQCCGCNFVDGERPPPLEDLELVRYPFSYNPVWEGEMVGYRIEVPERDYWVDVFDWSRLRRLKTGLTDFAIQLMPHLTALEEVDFQNITNEISSFLEQVPSRLHSITVSNMTCVSLEALQRHGETLRKLEMHQDEPRYADEFDWRDEAVTHAFLCQIQKHCQGLDVLSVDVARHGGEWPWSTLDRLASLPRLRSLTINFELGCMDDEHPVQPFVTFTAAHELAAYLYARNPRLRQLDLVSGSPPPLGFGLPGPRAFWPRDNSTRFACRLSERDDEAAKGVFVVHCPDLEKVLADKSQGAWRRGAIERLARLGPTPWSEGDLS